MLLLCILMVLSKGILGYVVHTNNALVLPTSSPAITTPDGSIRQSTKYVTPSKTSDYFILNIFTAQPQS